MINVTVFACANQRLQIGTAKYTKDAKEKQFEFSRILHVSRLTILAALVFGMGYGCFCDYLQRAVPSDFANPPPPRLPPSSKLWRTGRRTRATTDKEAGVPMPGGRYEADL